MVWTQLRASRQTQSMNKKLFFVGVILTASGLISPPLALLGGLAYGLVLAHPFHVESRNLSKFLLQASVVGLGFGMNLSEVIHAGRSGFLYTALSITAAMLFGLGLGFFIAKTLLERSGAKLSMMNQAPPLHGATIKVSWDRAAFERPLATPPSPPLEPVAPAA